MKNLGTRKNGNLVCQNGSLSSFQLLFSVIHTKQKKKSHSLLYLYIFPFASKWRSWEQVGRIETLAERRTKFWLFFSVTHWSKKTLHSFQYLSISSFAATWSTWNRVQRIQCSLFRLHKKRSQKRRWKKRIFAAVTSRFLFRCPVKYMERTKWFGRIMLTILFYIFFSVTRNTQEKLTLIADVFGFLFRYHVKYTGMVQVGMTESLAGRLVTLSSSFLSRDLVQYFRTGRKYWVDWRGDTVCNSLYF